MTQDYKYVRAWGKLMHSFPYYIESQVAEARKDEAPETACYYSSDAGRWILYEELASVQTRQAMRTILAQMEGQQ